MEYKLKCCSNWIEGVEYLWVEGYQALFRNPRMLVFVSIQIPVFAY
jgi:hypothetical protein